MERRQFIGLSAFMAAAISLPVFQSCSSGAGEAAIGDPAILARILDKKSIIETGGAYRKQYPEEDTKNKLRQLLLPDGSSASSSDANSIHAYFNKKAVEDFNSNNTIVVNGWVLSRTEARQCALFSILQS